METLKKIFKSRTIILAILQAVVGIVLVIATEQPELFTTGFGLMLKTLIDIYLRLDTKDSIVL